MKKVSIRIKGMEQMFIKHFCNPRVPFNKFESSLLISIFLILFGTQCKKESTDIINSHHQLTPRINTNCWNNTESDSAVSGTFQSGTYTITNNCIRFTNHEEFNKTELFINHATASEVQSWYNHCLFLHLKRHTKTLWINITAMTV